MSETTEIIFGVQVLIYVSVAKKLNNENSNTLWQYVINKYVGNSPVAFQNYRP